MLTIYLITLLLFNLISNSCSMPRVSYNLQCDIYFISLYIRCQNISKQMLTLYILWSLSSFILISSFILVMKFLASDFLFSCHNAHYILLFCIGLLSINNSYNILLLIMVKMFLSCWHNHRKQHSYKFLNMRRNLIRMAIE